MLPEACSGVHLSPGALGKLFSGSRQSDARVANPSLLEGTEEAWATEGPPLAQPGGSFYISQELAGESEKSLPSPTVCPGGLGLGFGNRV